MSGKITPETAPVGARLLVRSYLTTLISEVEVLEWAPSGRFARLHYAGGCKVWEEKLPYFIELLPSPLERRLEAALENLDERAEAALRNGES